MTRFRRISAVVLAASVLLTGCDGAGQSESAPTVTVDESLTPLLVTRTDFTGWSVQDFSDQVAEESKSTPKRKADPPECDSSDKTSLTSAVAAMVSQQQGKPGVLVSLSRQRVDTLVADTEKWLSDCKGFSSEQDGVRADTTVQRLDPPASEADAQVGYEMESTARAGSETVEVSVAGYTAQVGDVLVMAVAMGGDAGIPGRRVVVNRDMLTDVFVAQVAKIKAADAAS
jgi:hypothetical protein